MFNTDDFFEDYITVTGKNIDEAIEKASEILNVEKVKVLYKGISQNKKEVTIKACILTDELLEKIHEKLRAEEKQNPIPRPKPIVITCPYCKSTNTKKISGISKAGSVALWGIFAAGKVSKQWHCNNCGSDF